MMKDSFRGLLVGLCVGVAALVVPSCGGATSGGGGTDSNTHWLSSCTSDADCGSLTCLCGECTKPCTEDSACSGLAGNATCETASCAPATSKVCTVKCTSASDCPEGGARFTCRDGECAPAPIRIVDDAGSGAPTCPETFVPGAPCTGSASCVTACAGGWQSHFSCDGRHWVAGLGLIPCGPDAGVADAGSTCPETFVPGAPCNGPAGTCFTACAGGWQSQFACDGGHWVAGHGLFPCGRDAGVTSPDAGVTSHDAGAGCAPMDASSDPTLLCPGSGPLGYAWSGTACAGVVCRCVGKDCGALYPTLGDCEEAHAECFPGVTRACGNSSQCRIVGTRCCGYCGAPTLNDLAAVTAGSEPAWDQAVCPISPPCDACAGSPGTIDALCVSGECDAVDLKQYKACQRDSDCVVQTTICCGECSDDVNAFVAVSDPGGFSSKYGPACIEDCVACFTDSGTPRRGPSWLHARCDTTIGACVLQQDPH